MSSHKKYKEDLEHIEKYLRNKVAHAANYAQNDQEIERFICLIGLTQEWINELESYQSEHDTIQPE